jgi:hypothetical protein
MVSVDLNMSPEWNEVFRQVEAGEVVQVMRGKQMIALVQPSATLAGDEEYIAALGEIGVRQLAEITKDDDFADWK